MYYPIYVKYWILFLEWIFLFPKKTFSFHKNYNDYRNGGMKMENEIVKILMKECNFKEKIIIKVFTKVFIKVYNIARIQTTNCLL